jgi:hypothetical protein
VLEVADGEDLRVWWEAIESRVVWPSNWNAPGGPPTEGFFPADCQRRFARRELHTPAVLVVDRGLYAGYAKDVSREGLGFFAPVHLLPKQRIYCLLGGSQRFVVRITRCRRLGPNCFECGSRFDRGTSDG